MELWGVRVVLEHLGCQLLGFGVAQQRMEHQGMLHL